MRLVSPLMRQVVYPVLSRTGYFRRAARRGQLSVVTYHGVLPEGYTSTDPVLDGNMVSAQSFREQLRWLKKYYQVIPPEEFRARLESGREFESRSVLLTCDDGLRNTLTDMLPILRDEGLSCLFFVTGLSAADEPRTLWYEDLYLMMIACPAKQVFFEEIGFRAELGSFWQRQAVVWDLVSVLSACGSQVREHFLQTLCPRIGLTENWQDERHDREDYRLRFWLLRASELRGLAACGMTIGAHTTNHLVLSQLDPESAMAEMHGCRSVLESVLGEQVWAFAYPFGDPSSVTPRDAALAKKAGFRCAFVNFGGGFGTEMQHFAIPRVHVSAQMGIAEFDAHVSGFHWRIRGRRSADRRMFAANGQSDLL